MAASTTESDLDVGGRRLVIRNLDRVVFPATGTTKADLLTYYAEVAAVMLPHLRGRLLHMHRYPEGVRGPRFWQKGCPEHRPEWMSTVPVWSRDQGQYIHYCVVNELASLLWAVNIGSIELHSSLHLGQDLDAPTYMVFDLDPGEGAGLLHCCEVALRVKELMDHARRAAFVKSSGSKGLQVYVPVHRGLTYESTKPLARRVAEFLEEQTPQAVVSRIAKSARAQRVLVDWSQNTPHKSMVCAYSVRAKERPTVSTPIDWSEVQDAVDAADPSLLTFELDAVLERVRERGDLFAPVLPSGDQADST